MSLHRRLCMVVHGPYPVGEPRVAREARAALDGGYEVDVIAMRQPGEAARELVEGVRVVRLPHLHASRTSGAALIKEYVGFTLLAAATLTALTLRRRYAVVQVHNPPDFLVLAALVPKLLGSKVVFDIHDLAPDLFAMRFAGRTGARSAERLLRRVESAMIRFSDAVVTVHEPYRRELRLRGVPDGKVTIVLNTVDERVLPPPPPPPPVSPSRNGFRVVYHGTVTSHYGIELVIEALATVVGRVPDLQFDVYGVGDALEEVRRRADELGVAESVCLGGRLLPHGEVLRKIQGASVGVVANLPVDRNLVALPTKLLEYTALGIPVVAADLPAIREHFSSDEVRFFSAGDSDSLAGALLDVATDPEGAAARAAAARARFANYCWPRYARDYVALLDRLTAAHRQRGSGSGTEPH